jgi:4-hydroxy-2-oxoheptanedioate aldolase
MTDPVVGKLAHALAGDGVYAAWIGLNEPGIADAMAREAFDALVLDMQHGGVDFVGASRGISYAALAGKPTVVRVNVGDFAAASRLADAGAAGVIAPMINSGEDARRFGEFMKFPPLGRRSWGPRACLPFSGLQGADYLKGANAITLAIAMVETREAIDALDDILGAPGVDGVFVGPSDLSIALSQGASVDPRGPLVDTALTHIAARAKAHGKFAGLFCFDGPGAKAARARGFKFCSIATDVLMMRAAAKRELDAAR